MENNIPRDISDMMNHIKHKIPLCIRFIAQKHIRTSSRVQLSSMSSNSACKTHEIN